MPGSDRTLDWVLVLAPYRRDADYLRTLLVEHDVTVRQAADSKELATRLAEGPGMLVVTHEALDPAALEVIARHLADQPAWAEMPIIVLLDRAAPHARIRSELSAAWPRSRQIFYQRPVATLELLSGVQSALLSRFRQRDVRDHIEREVELRHELNHRVKNILASVRAMFDMTRRNTTSLDQFVEDFSGRLMALSNVHSAVFEAGSETIDFAKVVERTFRPYRIAGKDRVTAHGPAIEIRHNAGTTLALCLHELATNALKYGALSCPEGRVRVEWELSSDSEPMLTIRWVESGGPPVVEPSAPGYGTRYIRSAIRGLFGAPPEIVFDPQGLRCTITGPFFRIR
ncbi:sensor histidine kinase [Tsuneonella deserti]|uniref:histidine kinase n=1 Tax=Tsuneonella deserti TaxID=2035528 RepID=A0ABQ1SCU4_9SPHN|nr:sensor histidine kinase [Tsuneonella deserti]GGE05835.1 sensor histidine kinase [Tsuneonella deserti]